MSKTNDLCIHMAIHNKPPGTTCDQHQPIEVSNVDVISATEVDGIIVVKLTAYFHQITEEKNNV